MQSAVAKRYAQALFAIALEQSRVEPIDDQSKALIEIYNTPQIKNFFESPKVSASVKKRIVDSQFGGKFDKPVVNLVKLLVDKRRIRFLPDIMACYDLLTDIHVGVEEVTIVSAVPLADPQVEAIVNEVRRFSAYGKLRVKTEVDSGVLAGIKVRLGDNLVIDGTASSRLSAMQQRMYKYRHRGVGA